MQHPKRSQYNYATSLLRRLGFSRNAEPNGLLST